MAKSILENQFFYPPKNMICTKPFSRFLTEYHSHLDYFFFIIQLVTRADEMRIKAASVLIESAENKKEKARFQASIDDKDATLNQLRKHANVQSQNLTNGAVSAFQRYFSGIIQAAVMKKPKILSSSQQIKINEVLRFTRHGDLIA